MSASSCLRSVISAATRATNRARSAGVVVRLQEGYAPWASVIAATRSASETDAYSRTVSPVAGLVTAYRGIGASLCFSALLLGGEDVVGKTVADADAAVDVLVAQAGQIAGSEPHRA